MKWLACICIALLAGCSDSNPASTVSSTTTTVPPPPSAAQSMVNDLTGYSNVKAGRKAQEQIRAISADRNADLEEATQK